MEQKTYIVVTVQWTYASGAAPRPDSMTVPAPDPSQDVDERLRQVQDAVLRGAGLDPEAGQPASYPGGAIDNVLVLIERAPAEHADLVGQSIGRVWDDEED